MAIAYDSSVKGSINGTVLSLLHTASGTDRIVFVTVNEEEASVSAVTSVEYAGVPMTLLKRCETSGAQTALWVLINPATGGSSVNVFRTGSGFIAANVSSYTGVDPSGVEVLNFNNGTNSNAQTTSVTVQTANSWLVGAFGTQGNWALSAGAGTTARQTNPYLLIGDSNGVVGTGSQSMAVTDVSTEIIQSIVVAICPSGVASTIAFDATTACGASGSATVSTAHTCSGTNRLLFVLVRGYNLDAPTAVTYAGVAMTQLGSSVVAAGGGSSGNIWLYYLINPATGTNNVSITMSGSHGDEAIAISYNGVKQTGFPDYSGTGSATTLSFGLTATTVADKSWIATFGTYASNTPQAQIGSIVRRVAGGLGTYVTDSNRPMSPNGNKLMSVGYKTSQAYSGMVVSFAPVASAVNSGFFALM